MVDDKNYIRDRLIVGKLIKIKKHDIVFTASDGIYDNIKPK